jgi:Type I phosphodiesterase / nucleotide pyrophosphatase
MMLARKCALALLAGVALGATAQAADIDHVLLISVDGLHALDVARYVEKNPGSALAELAEHGTTYSNARTPANSDSFPGLLALVTGGSPISHGFFYDVSYDRSLYDPTNPTCMGQPGNTLVLDESIDVYAGTPPVSKNVIDPTRLPNGRDKNGKCVRFYPHDLMRANTIFEVVKSNGGHTAWADKHPAYDIVNGPSGKGVDDLYTPELTNFGGFDNTTSVVCTVQNDELKVQGVLNEIRGLKHDGSPNGGIVPTVFGMNFQGVSVGQKLSGDGGGCGGPFKGQPGGYLDGSGTPTAVLAYGLQQTDEALGDMIKTLKAHNLYDSTLIIVTAKHGQSPINPKKINKPGHFADLVAALAASQGQTSNPGVQAIANANNCSIGPCGFAQDDDIALIWFAPSDQANTQAAIDYLNANAPALFIDEVLGGDELKLKFNDPKNDSRTPDIIVQPIYGTVYTGSKAKNAEHGGMSFGDTNVGLIVSNPRLPAVTLKTPVATSQVAPTILQALDMEPEALKSVRVELTKVLPGLWGGER